LAICLPAAPLHAGRPVESGNDLLDRCASAPETTEPVRILNDNICFSYIQGAIDAARTQAALDAAKQPFCIPDGVTLGQLRDMVVQELRADPSERHLGADLFVLTPMVKSFPCAANRR
jgi:hypothetical protein